MYKHLSHQLIYEQKLKFRDLVPDMNFTLHLSFYIGKIIPQTSKYSVMCMNKGQSPVHLQGCAIISHPHHTSCTRVLLDLMCMHMCAFDLINGILTLQVVMGPAYIAFQTVVSFHSVAGGMVDWSGLAGWGDRRWEVERAWGGGGNGSERKIEGWRVVGGKERREVAPESFLPVTSHALVPGCAALRSRLSRNHLPTVETRASAVR